MRSCCWPGIVFLSLETYTRRKSTNFKNFLPRHVVFNAFKGIKSIITVSSTSHEDDMNIVNISSHPNLICVYIHTFIYTRLYIHVYIN
jgi:hypothetical protein